MAEARHAIEQAFQSNNRELEVGSVYAMGASCNPSWLPSLLPQLQTGDGNCATRPLGRAGKSARKMLSVIWFPCLRMKTKTFSWQRFRLSSRLAVRKPGKSFSVF
jgi:hypothetical protein